MQADVSEMCANGSLTLLTQKRDNDVSVKFKDKELPEL